MQHKVLYHPSYLLLLFYASYLVVSIVEFLYTPSIFYFILPSILLSIVAFSTIFCFVEILQQPIWIFESSGY